MQINAQWAQHVITSFNNLLSARLVVVINVIEKQMRCQKHGIIIKQLNAAVGILLKAFFLSVKKVSTAEEISIQSQPI